MARLRPRPLSLAANEGFTKENDIFELREFGENLANLVQGIDDSLVVLVDGPWGSGKSTFISQWCGLLRARNVPVVAFDAFGNDHQEDAFTAIAGEIVASVFSLIEDETELRAAFFEKAQRVGSILLPLAVKATLRAGTLGILSSDDINIGAELKQAAEEASQDFGSLAEGLIKDRVANATHERQQLEDFRTSLAAVIKQLQEKNGNTSPLVFVIDELDRCRPTFAINVLERIKHLFAIPGICFVLVTYKPQLETAIKGMYGPEFDAANYMRKFYHVNVQLPSSSLRENRFNKIQKYVEHLWLELEIDSSDANYSQRLRNGISNLASGHGLELRDLQHIMASVSLFMSATKESTFRLDPFVGVLVIMAVKQPELFEKCMTGSIQWADVKDFIGKSNWSDPNSTLLAYYIEVWRGTLDKNWNDDDGKTAREYLSKVITNYRLRNMRDGLTFVARLLADIRVETPN